MHPIIQSPRDRQLILGSGIRVQSAGHTDGGVVSQYAVSFDGADDYIDCGNPASLQITSSLSISAWVKPSNVSGSKNICSKWKHGVEGAYLLCLDGSKVEFDVFNTASSLRQSSVLLVAYVWHHVVGVYNASLQTLDIYVNGSLSNGALIGAAVPASIKSIASNVRIGAAYNSINNPSTFFNGLIDDLRIYNRALTAPEVASIYANIASPPTDGLVAYFDLEEGTGTTTTDEIAGLVGTLTNGPTWSTDVPAALQ